MNLRMLQHLNAKCNIRILILRMLQNDVFLVILWSLSLALTLNLYLTPNKHEYLMIFI